MNTSNEPRYTSRAEHMVVKQVGTSSYSSTAINVYCDDAGVFLRRGNQAVVLHISPKEWPTLRDAITLMMSCSEIGKG